MGLLSFLFGKRIKIHDPVLGEMAAIGSKSGITSFESSTFFRPTGKRIVLIIDAENTGPTKEQKHFFGEIEKNYRRVSQSIVPFIESEFRNWKADFSIVSFPDEFDVDTISIPYSLQEPIVWEIIFTSVHDSNHWFIVSMQNFEATNLLIDG